MSDKSSRTERATAQKRQKARRRGQIFRSREVAGAASFLGAVLAIAGLAGYLRSSVSETMVHFLAASATTTRPVSELTADALRRAALAGGPLMGVAVLASLAGNFAQSPPVFTFEPFTPDAKRFFSLSKLTNMFSMAGAANLFRGVVGLSALSLVGYSVLAPVVSELGRLSSMASVEMASFVGGVVMRLLFRGALVFGIIAAADYALNHRKFEEDMKMTKQEVKDEHKQLEGDPQVKARVRRVQRAAARRRMMSMVPKATVVVTNPTHVAVALLYDAETSPAPRIVAKGKGELALRIREIARKNDVVIYEDPPLARALYAVDVDQIIPPELYKAVAEVLAHLVRASGLRF